jgi:hypothetical protein
VDGVPFQVHQPVAICLAIAQRQDHHAAQVAFLERQDLIHGGWIEAFHRRCIHAFKGGGHQCRAQCDVSLACSGVEVGLVAACGDDAQQLLAVSFPAFVDEAAHFIGQVEHHVDALRRDVVPGREDQQVRRFGDLRLVPAHFADLGAQVGFFTTNTSNGCRPLEVGARRMLR